MSVRLIQDLLVRFKQTESINDLSSLIENIKDFFQPNEQQASFVATQEEVPALIRDLPIVGKELIEYPATIEEIEEALATEAGDLEGNYFRRLKINTTEHTQIENKVESIKAAQAYKLLDLVAREIQHALKNNLTQVKVVETNGQAKIAPIAVAPIAGPAAAPALGAKAAKNNIAENENYDGIADLFAQDEKADIIEKNEIPNPNVVSVVDTPKKAAVNTKVVTEDADAKGKLLNATQSVLKSISSLISSVKALTDTKKTSDVKPTVEEQPIVADDAIDPQSLANAFSKKVDVDANVDSTAKEESAFSKLMSYWKGASVKTEPAVSQKTSVEDKKVDLKSTEAEKTQATVSVETKAEDAKDKDAKTTDTTAMVEPTAEELAAAFKSIAKKDEQVADKASEVSAFTKAKNNVTNFFSKLLAPTVSPEKSEVKDETAATEVKTELTSVKQDLAVVESVELTKTEKSTIAEPVSTTTLSEDIQATVEPTPEQLAAAFTKPQVEVEDYSQKTIGQKLLGLLTFKKQAPLVEQASTQTEKKVAEPTVAKVEAQTKAEESAAKLNFKERQAELLGKLQGKGTSVEESTSDNSTVTEVKSDVPVSTSTLPEDVKATVEPTPEQLAAAFTKPQVEVEDYSQKTIGQKLLGLLTFKKQAPTTVVKDINTAAIDVKTEVTHEPVKTEINTVTEVKADAPVSTTTLPEEVKATVEPTPEQLAAAFTKPQVEVEDYSQKTIGQKLLGLLTFKKQVPTVEQASTQTEKKVAEPTVAKVEAQTKAEEPAAKLNFKERQAELLAKLQGKGTSVEESTSDNSTVTEVKSDVPVSTSTLPEDVKATVEPTPEQLAAAFSKPQAEVEDYSQKTIGQKLLGLLSFKKQAPTVEQASTQTEKKVAEPTVAKVEAQAKAEEPATKLNFKERQAELLAKMQGKGSTVEDTDASTTTEESSPTAQPQQPVVTVEANDTEITPQQFADAFSKKASPTTKVDGVQALADIAVFGSPQTQSPENPVALDQTTTTSSTKSVIPPAPKMPTTQTLSTADKKTVPTAEAKDEPTAKKSIATLLGKKDAADKPADFLSQIKAGKKLKHVDTNPVDGTPDSATSKSSKVSAESGSGMKEMLVQAFEKKVKSDTVKVDTQVSKGVMDKEESEFDREERIEKQVRQNEAMIDDAILANIRTVEFKQSLTALIKELDASLHTEIATISKAYVAKMANSASVSTQTQGKIETKVNDIQAHCADLIHEQLLKSYDAALKATRDYCNKKAAQDLHSQMEMPLVEAEVQDYIHKMFESDITKQIADIILKGMKDILANDEAFVNDANAPNAGNIDAFKNGFYADKRSFEQAVKELEPKQQVASAKTETSGISINDALSQALAKKRVGIQGVDEDDSNDESDWSDDDSEAELVTAPSSVKTIGSVEAEELAKAFTKKSDVTDITDSGYFTAPTSAKSSVSIAAEDLAKAFTKKPESPEAKGGVVNNILDFGKGLFGFGAVAKQPATTDNVETSHNGAKPNAEVLTLTDVLGHKPIQGLENSGPVAQASASPQVAVDAHPTVLTQNVLPTMEQQHTDAL